MYLTISLWRWFSPEYAPGIIYWTSNQKYVRKLIAGGSFTYYEYKDDINKIGFFEPISRFLNLMIAFLGVSTTLAKTLNFTPESPVETSESVLIWTLLMIFVPILLTPIVPIIWTMEDLGLKAWNAKSLENWRVSIKYKKRFNSFIAVGAITVGLGLTSDANQDIFQSVIIYLNILVSGFILLTYPIAVLTLLYYLLFRRSVNKEVRNKMDIVTAKTILEIVDPITGDAISKKILEQTNDVAIEGDDQEIEGEEIPSDLKIHQKLGRNMIKPINILGDQTVGRINTIFKKRKVNKQREKKSSEKQKIQTKKTYTGGSATKGLWGKEEEDD